MSKYEDKPDTGFMVKREKRTEKSPDFTGDVIWKDGEKRRVAAWYGTSKAGNPYFSLKFSDPLPQKEDMKTSQPQAASGAAGDGFDEIPF